MDAADRLARKVPDTERDRHQAQSKRKKCTVTGENAPRFKEREASGNKHYDTANAIHRFPFRRLGLTAPPPNPYRE